MPGMTAEPTTTTCANVARLDSPTHPRLASVGRAARITLATLACLWLALCTSVGPLYWSDGSLADFGWTNALYFLLALLIYGGIVIALTRFGAGQPTLGWHHPDPETGEREPRRLTPPGLRAWATSWSLSLPGTAIRRLFALLGRTLTRATNRTWKLATILTLGWLWVPTTLLAIFGSDLRSQFREFSWAWNQWTGLKQPYIGFFSFVPMDVYPTAHYLWPDAPTYLTDQHNILLTLIYGATGAMSRYLTGSNDCGIIALGVAQFFFAVFCCAATMQRFLNAKRLATPAGPVARLLILVFFLCCPLAVFATISLTKSPLFAFAFVWWFGIWWELHATRGQRMRRHSLVAFVVATCVMLASAKYAWYIIALQFVLALIADRRRWRVYAVALLLPTMIIHGGTVAAVNAGMIIGGDPIESRGVQLQQIASVAKFDPDSIPESAKRKLEPVFNLDQMADAYVYQDADPVKSSGIQSKKVSYKWRTVTSQDMEDFNAAWLEIVRASPVVALDALLAKCFGYFDVADMPYIPMSYYVNNDQVQRNTAWIRYVNHNWRETVTNAVNQWSAIPVVGWLIHGNTYVIATLLVGAAEVLLRRWRTLAWHMPLLLLMGVMITAPANNFERHMLPVAFVFGFLCLTFFRESTRGRSGGTTAIPGAADTPTPSND